MGSYIRDNVAYRGEDFRRGETVLTGGRQIKPQDIAILASAGKVSVEVSKMPSVGVISSGDELVEPQFMPGESQIRNSNSWQIMAQIKRAGGAEKYYGIARDNESETYKIISKAISENDMVIITGGVSMGDFDFIPKVLKRAGVRLLFDRVAVKPGKPTTFGIHENAIVFGLPGNPVSAFMIFEMLVRPFISAMMNYNWKPLHLLLPMKEDFSRRSSQRMALIPAKITDDNCISPVDYHGSAHITSLSEADGIFFVPAGVKKIEKGTAVTFNYI